MAGVRTSDWEVHMESVLLVNGPPAERKIHREVLERAGYPVKEVLALDMALRSARRPRCRWPA